jgi:hypothetical protein
MKQRSFVKLLGGDFIAKRIEDSENIRRLLDKDSVRLGLEIFSDLYKGLGDKSLSDEKFLEILPCDAFKMAVEDSNFILNISPEVLYKMIFFSNITLEDGSKTDLYHCVGARRTKALLTNYDLVRRFSRDNMVQISNEKCCDFFDKATTDTALKTYPDLPLYINDRALQFGLWFFEDQTFLDRLPCPVYMYAISNTTFVERLNSRALKAMSINEHLWRCTPIEYVRQMMKTSSIGRKLNIEDALMAAKVLVRVHALDPEVALNIFEHQFPQMRERYEDMIIQAKLDASQFKFVRGHHREEEMWYSYTDN